jgi:hypothetical protein
MGLSKGDEDKKVFDKNDLADMFSNIPTITNNLIIDNSKKKLYDAIKLGKLARGESQAITQKDTDDLCPICLDDLENGDELDFCKYSCGKSIHVKCFSMWCKVRPEQNCVFCKHSWLEKPKEKSNYINLCD